MLPPVEELRLVSGNTPVVTPSSPKIWEIRCGCVDEAAFSFLFSCRCVCCALVLSHASSLLRWEDQAALRNQT